MIDSMMQLLRALLHNPGSDAEFAISAILGIVGFVVTVTYVGSVTELKAVRTVREAIILCLALLVGLCAASLTVGVKGLPPWGPWVAGGIAVAVLVVPAMCFIMKGSYFSCLVTAFVGIGGAVLIMLISHTIFSGIGNVETSVGQGLRHHHDTKLILED